MIGKNRTSDRPNLEQNVDKRRRIAFGAGIYLVVIGTGLLGFAAWRFFWFGRGIGLVAPAGTILAAGAASVVATLGIVSWAEQRRRDRELTEYQNREKIYGDIISFMVGRFTGGPYDTVKDGNLRAVAGLWASEEVINLLREWQDHMTSVLESKDAVIDPLDGSVSVSLNETDQEKCRDLIGQTIVAMRKDLSSSYSDDLNKTNIIGSIFNVRSTEQTVG